MKYLTALELKEIRKQQELEKEAKKIEKIVKDVIHCLRLYGGPAHYGPTNAHGNYKTYKSKDANGNAYSYSPNIYICNHEVDHPEVLRILKELGYKVEVTQNLLPTKYTATVVPTYYINFLGIRWLAYETVQWTVDKEEYFNTVLVSI